MEIMQRYGQPMLFSGQNCKPFWHRYYQGIIHLQHRCVELWENSVKVQMEKQSKQTCWLAQMALILLSAGNREMGFLTMRGECPGARSIFSRAVSPNTTVITSSNGQNSMLMDVGMVIPFGVQVHYRQTIMSIDGQPMLLTFWRYLQGWRPMETRSRYVERLYVPADRWVRVEWRSWEMRLILSSPLGQGANTAFEDAYELQVLPSLEYRGGT